MGGHDHCTPQELLSCHHCHQGLAQHNHGVVAVSELSEHCRALPQPLSGPFHLRRIIKCTGMGGHDPCSLEQHHRVLGLSQT